MPPLLVAAERVAATVAQGVHGRRRVGQGETFWQFRQYQPGDAATRIDWRESAKSQRLYVRETEWEAAQSVWLWRDASASMDYSSAGYIAGAEWPTKRDRAELLLVALASLLVRGGERLTLLGSGVAPMTGRVALTRLVAADRARRRAQAAATLGLPAFEPLPRAGQLVLIGDFLAPLDTINAAVARFAGAGLKGHLLQIADPAEEDLPFAGRVRFEGVEERGRDRDQPGRDRPRRLCRALPASSRGPGRDRAGGRLDASAITAPTGRRTWRCSRSTRALTGAIAARARSPMLALGSLAFASPWLLAGARRAAGDLVAAAGDAAGAAPHRLSGDPAAARADPARGDAGAHAVVADPVAHGRWPRWSSSRWPIRCSIRRRGSPATGPVALVIDDGWAAARDWSRRQAAAIDLLAEAEREDRQVVLVTTAPPASRRAGAAAGADPRRRCARGGAGAAAEAVAGRPPGGAWPGCEAMPLPQGSIGGLAQRRRRGRRRRRALAAYLAGSRQRALHRGGRRPMRRACSLPTPPRASWRRRISGSSCARCRRRCRGRSRCGRAARTARLLAREAATLAPGDDSVAVRLTLPTELRNRVTRIEVEGEQSAGGGAAGRRALAAPAGRHRRCRRTPPASRCSARPSISSARSARSPRCAAAAPPTC